MAIQCTTDAYGRSAAAGAGGSSAGASVARRLPSRRGEGRAHGAAAGRPQHSLHPDHSLWPIGRFQPKLVVGKRDIKYIIGNEIKLGYDSRSASVSSGNYKYKLYNFVFYSRKFLIGNIVLKSTLSKRKKTFSRNLTCNKPLKRT